MKLVSLFLVVLAVACAQPANTSGRMPFDEIARRMIRKQFQGRTAVPERVTFSSVKVNSQGTDSYIVNATFTLRGYYNDSTLVHDYDGRYKLFKQGDSWQIETDSANMGPGRYEAKSAAPPAGETDVPAPSAAATQPDRGVASRGSGALPLGKYNCVMSSGGQLIHVGGFTLQAAGVYKDEDDGSGTFNYDLKQHQIRFQGAAMSGQVGRYDSAGGTFTLKSARNSVDCDRGN